MKNNLLLVLAPDCHECDEVQAYVSSRKLNIETQNLTFEEIESSEYFVFPLLKNDKSIVAYGSDIIRYLDNR